MTAMNKSVEFTGIVRNLPDIKVADGTMQELINLRPKDGAWRPVGTKIRTTESLLTDVRSIHKISETLVVYIGISGSGYLQYYYKIGATTSVVTTTTLACSENTKFASWHNVLMVSDATNEALSLLLYDEDANEYSIFSGAGGASWLPDMPQVTFDRVAESASDDTNSFDHSGDNDKEALLAEYLRMMHDKADLGFLTGIVLARCAWEMSDGTIIKQTIPDKIGSSHIEVAFTDTDTIGTTFTAYRVRFKLNCTSDWLTDVKTKYKNLIKGLNIYISLPRAAKATDRTVVIDFPGRMVPNWEFDAEDLSDYSPDVEKESYFLLKHYSLDSLTADTFTQIDNETLNDLSTRSQMPINNLSHHSLFGERLFVYNDRIFLGKIKNYPYKGDSMNGLVQPASGSPGSGDPYRVGIEYDIVISSRQTITVFTGWSNEYDYYDAQYNLISFRLKYLTDVSFGRDPIFFSYLGYPDSRAKVARVFVTLDNGTTVRIAKTIQLTSVQDQNFSYSIGSSVYQAYSAMTLSALKVSNSYYYDPNRIQACDIGNPFFYPAINSYRVQGTVLGMSTNAVALSQGQFGEYPIFAFTSEGIWALKIGSGEVLISTITPLSRDVCNNPDSIVGVDGGSVFTTDKGLFVVSGSNVIELSTLAEGPNTSPLADLASYISIMNNPNLYQLSGYTCTVSFTSYIAGAVIGWDYKNKEIIVSNSSYAYSWVYTPASKTWHKISQVFDRFISDYPVCYGYRTISGSLYKNDMTNEEYADLVSVHLETRPLKLSVNAFKKIIRLLLEGFINQNNDFPFSLNLYGSTNKINWYLLSSSQTFGAQVPLLIGRATFSCRYYILVAGGRADDESYITGFTVDFEERYQHKLR